MAEQLTNEFTVNRPIEEAWPIITDVERIAPCLPGAQLKEVEGDTYRGVVKVKLGPITTQFKGEAEIREQDDDAHRIVIDAAGRDTTGKGNAKAVITANAESLSPTSTRCVVETELHMSGKVAQFGRTGVLTEVSGKLMEQFANNLNTMLDEQQEAGEELPAPTGDARPGPDDAAEGAAASSDEQQAPKVRKIEGPASEPIDLMEVGGGSMVKRAAPALAVLLIVLLLIRRLRA
jgi:carbon monoxide dehydrogenase subunit G